MDIVEKIMKIAKPPREVDILHDKKRKLEKKMWKALTEEERLEYIRLRKEIRDSESKKVMAIIKEKCNGDYSLENITKVVSDNFGKCYEYYGQD